MSNLEDIFERNFNLRYFLNMNTYDLQELELTEIRWNYGRLIKQRSNERKTDIGD